MAYYFMVERNKGQYQPLNISESKYFQTIPKFKKIGAYNLKEIDDFTMMFDNEEELRKALVSEEVLHPSISAKPLSIRCLKDGTFNRVEYDLLYQKDIEHMNCPEKLIKMITDKSEVSFRGASTSEFLTCILSDIALNANNANNFYGNFDNVGKAIDNQRLSISGVDTDEEAVNLVKYQNAYTLASKMIQTLTEVYDRLILETGV